MPARLTFPSRCGTREAVTATPSRTSARNHLLAMRRFVFHGRVLTFRDLGPSGREAPTWDGGGTRAPRPVVRANRPPPPMCRPPVRRSPRGSGCRLHRPTGAPAGPRVRDPDAPGTAARKAHRHWPMRTPHRTAATLALLACAALVAACGNAAGAEVARVTTDTAPQMSCAVTGGIPAVLGVANDTGDPLTLGATAGKPSRRAPG